MTERPWTIDAGLARDLAATLGWRPEDGVAALTARLPERVPMGSTAKVAAVAAGEVPPGADLEDLAHRLLAHQHRLADAPEGGAPSPAWSCWVVAPVLAALIECSGLGPADVAVTRRTDDRSPVVDLHAAVVTPGADGGRWVCDPYFGVAVLLPTAAGAVGRQDSPLAEASVWSDGSGWAYAVRLKRWDQALAYRLLGPSLVRGDVVALTALSVTHSGVPTRPYVRLHHDGTVIDALETEDGTAALRTWSAATGVLDEAHATWADAAQAFAARTGTLPI